MTFFSKTEKMVLRAFIEEFWSKFTDVGSEYGVTEEELEALFEKVSE